MKGNINMSVDSTGGAGKAVASAFIPGLGQFCDGRNKAGAGYMASNVALNVGTMAAGYAIAKDVVKLSEKAVAKGVKEPQEFSAMAKEFVGSLSKAGKAKYAALIALPVISTGLWIANIVDAYKGNRK